MTIPDSRVVATMNSRGIGGGGGCGGSCVVGGISGNPTMQRQMKKVSVPIVPDIGTMVSTNQSPRVGNGATCQSLRQPAYRSVLSNTTFCDDHSDVYGGRMSKSTTRPNALLLPSTNTSISSSNLCQTMRQSLTSQEGCMATSGVLYPSTSSANAQLRALCSDHGIGDLMSNECHRNSTGSNSSRGSSSGFESMKSGSSRGGSSGVVASASSSSSSFLAASTSSSASVVVNGIGLMRGDSPQSRISVRSSSSCGTSSVASTSVDALDDHPNNTHPNAHYATTNNLYHQPVSRSHANNAVCVPEMVLKGIPEAEILALWLDRLGHSEYLSVFLTQGYDLATIARITPEDLTALGITQPAHRKQIIAEIHTWHLTDSWPFTVPPGDLVEWLAIIGLPEYVELFESQGYYSMSEVQKLTWEDFEDVGIKKLGHLKRLGLAIKKLNDYRLGRLNSMGSDDKRMIPVAPYASARQSAQVKCIPAILHDYDHAPPPPAPTTTFHSNSVRSIASHIAAWNHYPRSFHASSLHAELPVHKPTVQVYPHHRSPVPCEKSDEHNCCAQSGGKAVSNSDVEAQSKFIRLSLCSPTQILSNEGYPTNFNSSHSAITSSSLHADALSVTAAAATTTTTSDSEDYPPPPAPLACEVSIRLLRSAFRDSPTSNSAGMICGADSQSMDIGCINAPPMLSVVSNNEQLPFANENCGTIRSRETATGNSHTQQMIHANSGTSSQSSSTPTRALEQKHFAKWLV